MPSVMLTLAGPLSRNYTNGCLHAAPSLLKPHYHTLLRPTVFLSVRPLLIQCFSGYTLEQLRSRLSSVGGSTNSFVSITERPLSRQALGSLNFSILFSLLPPPLLVFYVCKPPTRCDLRPKSFAPSSRLPSSGFRSLPVINSPPVPFVPAFPPQMHDWGIFFKSVPFPVLPFGSPEDSRCW